MFLFILIYYIIIVNHQFVASEKCPVPNIEGLKECVTLRQRYFKNSEIGTCECSDCSHRINIICVTLFNEIGKIVLKWRPDILQPSCEDACSNFCPPLLSSNKIQCDDESHGLPEEKRECRCKSNCIKTTLTCDSNYGRPQWLYDKDNPCERAEYKANDSDLNINVHYRYGRFNVSCISGYINKSEGHIRCNDGVYEFSSPQCEPEIKSGFTTSRFNTTPEKETTTTIQDKSITTIITTIDSISFTKIDNEYNEVLSTTSQSSNIIKDSFTTLEIILSSLFIFTTTILLIVIFIICLKKHKKLCFKNNSLHLDSQIQVSYYDKSNTTAIRKSNNNLNTPGSNLMYDDIVPTNHYDYIDCDQFRRDATSVNDTESNCFSNNTAHMIVQTNPQYYENAINLKTNKNKAIY